MPTACCSIYYLLNGVDTHAFRGESCEYNCGQGTHTTNYLRDQLAKKAQKEACGMRVKRWGLAPRKGELCGQGPILLYGGIEAGSGGGD